MKINNLVLSDIKSIGNSVAYIYNITGEWSRFFSENESFTVEYDFPPEHIPNSVLAIPFLCNVLPISWICDAEIRVPEIDRDFFESISGFKQGYTDMYPMLDFKGTLTARRIEDNTGSRSGAASLFSGGVDATHTMISRINEKPALISICGADVCFDDEKSWNPVKTHLVKTAGNFGLEYTTIKSSFRKVIRESALDQAVLTSGNGWWHGFQHGIALIGHTAPYMYTGNLKTLYIASSFNAEDKNVTGASYPTIDNFVRFCGSNTVHDAFDRNRQKKVGEICSFAAGTGTKINLRVCWESVGGGNCCKCEKCCRTMLAIAAEGHNPADYGFIWNKKIMRSLKYNLLWRFSTNTKPRYGPIIKRMQETAITKEQKKQWHWLISRTPEQIDNTFGKKVWNVVRKTRMWRFIRRKMQKQQ